VIRREVHVHFPLQKRPAVHVVRVLRCQLHLFSPI
jgi:hypothetical protein